MKLLLLLSVFLFACNDNPVIEKQASTQKTLKVIIEHTTGIDTLNIDNLNYVNGYLWNEAGYYYEIRDVKSFAIQPE